MTTEPAAVQLRPSYSVARSIHVGVNRVDNDIYRGWLPDLESAENDARAMRVIADGVGAASHLFLSERATRAAVTDAIESTIERLSPGDFLAVTYAGHMTTLSGAGDDADGWDEAWCLYDGILLDDEFHDLLSAVPKGADVLVVTDSCFAGGITDGADRTLAPAGAATATPSAQLIEQAFTGLVESFSMANLTARAPSARLGDREIGRLVQAGAIPRGVALPVALRRPIVARVVALAAATENELAYEADKHGLFTAAVLASLEEFGDARPTYEELMTRVAGLLQVQSPTFGTFGSAGSGAAASLAFTSSNTAGE